MRNLIDLFNVNPDTERLDELVNAPDQEVYHWTSADGLRSIFKYQTVTDRTVHKINGVSVQGVSLSRNPFFDIQDTYAMGGIKAWRIGFSLQKLKHNHKIIPMRYEPYRNKPKAQTLREPIQTIAGVMGMRNVSSDESEEFLIGSIDNIWKYITSISVELRHIEASTHPSSIDWDEEPFSNIQSATRDDQELLFDIMAGTVYGNAGYKNSWGRKRKNPITLPAGVKFNGIARNGNKVVDFKAYHADELDFPEQPIHDDPKPVEEAFAHAFLKQYGPQKGQEVTVFVNPNSKEWKECLGKNAMARAFLDNDRIYAWSAFDSIHEDVRRHLNLSPDAISLYMYNEGFGQDIEIQVTDNVRHTKWFHNPAVVDEIEENDWLHRSFSHISISFYDEDVYGDWRDLNDEDIDEEFFDEDYIEEPREELEEAPYQKLSSGDLAYVVNPKDIQTYMISSAKELENLTQKFAWVRMMLVDNGLLAWDASLANHNDISVLMGYDPEAHRNHISISNPNHEGVYKLDYYDENISSDDLINNPYLQRFLKGHMVYFFSHMTGDQMDIHTFGTGLTEAPIGDWQIDPNFDQNEAQMKRDADYDGETHWSVADKKAINDPGVISKVQKAFTNTPYTFDLYFWHSRNPDYNPTTQQGTVDLNWVKTTLGEDAYKHLLHHNKDHIAVVLTGNMSDDTYISLRSPWMIGHRIAHTLISGDNMVVAGYDVQYLFDHFVHSILEIGYGMEWPDPDTKDGYEFYHDLHNEYQQKLGHFLGTMRSARSEQLSKAGEWAHESFTQYLITGKVTLNPLPEHFDEGLDLTTDPDRRAIVEQMWKDFPLRCKDAFDALLNEAKGKIWVM